MDGVSCSMMAAAPDTWGQAIEVPLNDTEPVSEACEADTTSLPGAQMSVQLPKLLKDDLASVEVVEPTVMADGTKAGENVHASALLLPPATFTAASTASCIAEAHAGNSRMLLAHGHPVQCII